MDLDEPDEPAELPNLLLELDRSRVGLEVPSGDFTERKVACGDGLGEG